MQAIEPAALRSDSVHVHVWVLRNEHLPYGGTLWEMMVP